MPGKEKENMADLPIVTLTGAAAALGEAVVERFGSRLRGKLLSPSDAGYEEARLIWNGLIDKRPALIARCVGVADVIDSVNFARENDLLVAVRGGGHNVAGNAVADGGLVIDLSPMKGIRVDPERRTARAEGGATLGDIDRETQVFGLATPLGVVSETGIAGLTLGGGIGWLRRKYGLSSDNLVSVDLVTADGRFLTASEEENEDLLWGIRGGGGNFGVVTSFEYRLHPVGPEVMCCFVLYPGDRAREVLKFCDEYVAEAPDEVSPLAFLGHVPPVEIFPNGWHYYWKSVNLDGLGDEVIERLTYHAWAAPSEHSTIDVWYQGGAMARVGTSETAFGDRSSPILLGIEANWEDPQDDEVNLAWVRSCFSDMRRFSNGGLYLNFPGFLEEGEQLLRDVYGENYEQLVALKNKYDPTNLFRLNQNIKPTA